MRGRSRYAMSSSPGPVVQSWFGVNRGLKFIPLCISTHPFLVKLEKRKLSSIQMHE